MLKLRWGLGVAAALLVTAAGVRADDVASLKAELADLKAKVASMESTQMAPAAGGDCESLTSMKKKAAIKIGGEGIVYVQVVRRDDNPLAVNGENDKVNISEFNGEATLDLEVAASADAALKLRLDLEDFFDGVANEGDLLEEVYFQFKNVMCAPLTINFGKKELEAWGLDRTVGYNEGLSHGFAPVLNWTDGASVPASIYNTIGNVGTNSFISAEYDNLFMAEGIYSFQDLAKVYLAVFQSVNSGMHEDRSEDNLFGESFAAKLELTPVEGLKLQTSFLNGHIDSRGDKDIYGNKAEADLKAISVSAEYTAKCLPLSVWAEYLHAWDAGFYNDADNDLLTVGAEYGLTENLTLGAMFEWANVDNSSSNLVYGDEDYYDITAALTYTMCSGITMSLQYEHEWYDGDIKGGNDVDATADAVLFVTGFQF